MSDSGSDDGHSSGSETIEVRRPPPRKRKASSPEPEPITADEAIIQLSSLANRLSAKRGKRSKKINVGLNWRQVLTALKIEAVQKGFNESVLRAMWRIISITGTHIKMQHRKDLIFLMIPETIISKQFVDEIQYWLVGSNKVFKTLFIPILNYLLGLVQYALTDGESFRNPFHYTSLLALSYHTELIECLFRFLKKITTKEIVQRFHVLTVCSLWKRTVKPAQKKAIVDLLKLYKVLRPDYIPGNVFNINIMVKTTAKMTGFTQLFLKCLFEAKRRTTETAVPNSTMKTETQDDDDEPMDIYDQNLLINTNFFPELAPQFGDEFPLQTVLTDIKRVDATIPKNKIMLWALMQTETTPLLTIDGELLECFESWLSINFDHKFTQFDEKQRNGYEFVLQKCIEVSTLLGNGLVAVDDWLPNYLVNWDTQLFRSQILELFSYLNIIDFTDYTIIFQKFESDFLFGPPSRSWEVWDTLEKLLSRWIQLCNAPELERSFSEEDEIKSKLTVKNLFLYMNSILTKFISLHEKSKTMKPLALMFCKSYTKFCRGPFRSYDVDKKLITAILQDKTATSLNKILSK